MPTPTTTKQHLRCPRCGYDQSGLVASWTHSCPLVAICAECGYPFDPFDAIDPTRRRLPWLYEHAKRWWSVHAWFRTMLMLLWPPAFWKRVRPEHEVRPIRVALFLALPCVALVPLCVLMGLVSEIVTAQNWGRWNNQTVPWPAAVVRGTQAFWSSLTTPTPYRQLASATGALGFVIMAAIFWLPVAVAFLAIPSEWSGTPLRRAHLARLLGYAAASFFLGSVVMTVVNLVNGGHTALYYALSYPAQSRLRPPRTLEIPEWVRIALILVMTLLWPALYWFSAIRWGYALPSTRRPFLIVLAVLLTPWALFLLFNAYYAFIG